MPWFRTSGGRLIHGVGGLAAVYAARGWEPVPDDVAESEVASGEAQARADVEREVAKDVDARHSTDNPLTRPCPTCKALVGGWCQTKSGKRAEALHKARIYPTGTLTVTTGPPTPTAEDEAAVRKVLEEESPR